MGKGIVFDIQEFCVHDGPGARTTVFFKGCPLRCSWCHNPEGLSPQIELIRGAACTKCGSCTQGEDLLARGEGATVARLCPKGCLRVAGTLYETQTLAAMLLRQKESFEILGGGVTLSGGECLLQSEFAVELLGLIKGVHRAIETSGHAPEQAFLSVIAHCELVLFDIKHLDTEIHKHYTGVGNELVGRNLSLLMDSKMPFIARIPLIPGVNDDRAHLETVARRLCGASGLQRVELLPYNTNAGAKYGMIGRTFDPGFDTSLQPNLANADVFEEYGIMRVIV